MQDNPQPSSCGVIYKITNICNNKVYIGQTRNTITHRWYQHKQCAKRLLKYGYDNSKNESIKHSALYNAMIFHGIDKFIIEQIVTTTYELLNEEEKKHITMLNSLVPNGYNLLCGGNQQEHSNITIDHIRKTKWSRIDSNRNVKLQGLPPKVTYRNKGTYEEIVINHHTLCKHKVFSTKTYSSLEDAKSACIEFLNNLETNGITYTPNKNGVNLPKGVCLIENGYRVNKVINKKCYDKKFVNTNLTMEEKHNLAIEYLKQITTVQFND